MRTVTREEVEASRDYVHNMDESQTRSVMAQMSREQPVLQVYVAAILDRGDFEDDNDKDAFANLASIIWHAMRAAAGGRMGKVKPKEVDRCEAKMEKLLQYAGGEYEESWPRLAETVFEGYRQRPLLQYVLESLMSPDNPYGVTPDGSGLIFHYVKVIIDCLDNAPVYSPS